MSSKYLQDIIGDAKGDPTGIAISFGVAAIAVVVFPQFFLETPAVDAFEPASWSVMSRFMMDMMLLFGAMLLAFLLLAAEEAR